MGGGARWRQGARDGVGLGWESFLGVAGEVQQLKDFAAQAQKVRAVALARAREIDSERPFDATGARGHQNDAIAHVDCFVDVVGDEQHRCAARFPQAQHFILHAHAGECVESAEGFVKQEDFRVIDERASKRDALGHAAGEMVRVSGAERFQADEAHEAIDLIALFAQDPARDQACFDVAAHGEPGKEIGILEDQAALRARFRRNH